MEATEILKEHKELFQAYVGGIDKICASLGVKDANDILNRFKDMESQLSSMDKNRADLELECEKLKESFNAKDLELSTLHENIKKTKIDGELQSALNKFDLKDGIQSYLKSNLEKNMVFEDDKLLIKSQDKNGGDAKVSLNDYLVKLFSDKNSIESKTFLRGEENTQNTSILKDGNNELEKMVW